MRKDALATWASYPDEDWEVFYGALRVDMEKSDGVDTLRVAQYATIKLRRDADTGIWCP